MAKNNNRRPQAPKRRNFVAKHARDFNKAQVHRDRTKYDRYEDYLKDQLDDYVNDLDDPELAAKRAEFKAKLADEDPDMRQEYEDWLNQENETYDEYDDYE